MPTLYDKLWLTHIVASEADGVDLIYIDRMLLHEVSSPQAFAGLREAGRMPRRTAPHLAVADHAVSTHDRGQPIADPQARAQVSLLEANCAAAGIDYLPLTDVRQGIVHVIGPEQGFTLPGTTLVCGDSHTATHGAFGALAFGIGSSEAECVLATQTLRQKKARTMRVTIDGTLGFGVASKDLALALIGRIGAGGAVGHAIEYAGSTVRDLSMEARMTLCNMSIEAGSRTGLVAPDDKTFDWIQGRARAPQGAAFDRAVAYWQTLASDADTTFDREVTIDAPSVAPQVSWGTSPDQVASIVEAVPGDANANALAYMGLAAGQPLEGLAIDHVFIGSCTHGRIEDADRRRNRRRSPCRDRGAGDGRAGLGAGQAPGRSRGSAHPARSGRVRMARSRLLAVRRHERRPTRSRRTLRLDQQSQFRGAAGGRRADASDEPGDGSGGGGDGHITDVRAL